MTFSPFSVLRNIYKGSKGLRPVASHSKGVAPDSTHSFSLSGIALSMIIDILSSLSVIVNAIASGVPHIPLLFDIP